MTRAARPNRQPVRTGSQLTLGDALPREVVRVACEVLPTVARRGQDGQVELDAMIGALRLAGLALCRNDSRMMRRAHDELLGYHL